MFKSIGMLVVCCILTVGACLAQTSDGEEMDLPRYLSRVQMEDPEYQQFALQLTSLEGTKESAWAPYDVLFSGDTSLSTLGVSGFGPSAQQNKASLGLSIGADKLFKETGTRFGITYQNQHDRAIFSTGLFDEYQGRLELSIEQPLWRNAFGRLEQLTFQKLDQQEELVRLQVKEAQEIYLLAVGNQFYAWLLADISFLPLKENYKTAASLYNYIARQYKDDYVPESDLIQAKENKIKAELALIQQLQNWNQLGYQLFSRIDQEFTESSNWTHHPRLSAPKRLVFPDNQQLIRPLEALLSLKKVTQLEQDQFTEKAKSDVDLQLTGAMYQTGTDGFVPGGTEHADVKVGIAYSHNQNNHDIKGRLHALEARLQKISLSYRTIDQGYQTSAARLQSQLASSHRLFIVYQQLVTVARSNYRRKEQRYQHGKVSLKELLLAQDDIVSYEAAALREQVSQAGIQLELAALSDQLLSSLNTTE
ncbi:TolC family protein [Candidatus Margulisiibacteriota bacterium]